MLCPGQSWRCLTFCREEVSVFYSPNPLGNLGILSSTPIKIGITVTLLLLLLLLLVLLLIYLLRVFNTCLNWGFYTAVSVMASFLSSQIIFTVLKLILIVRLFSLFCNFFKFQITQYIFQVVENNFKLSADAWYHRHILQLCFPFGKVIIFIQFSFRLRLVKQQNLLKEIFFSY